MTERAEIVAWLRGLHWTHPHFKAAQFFADALDRGEHKETNDAQ
jgi:hypothetical protein